MIIKRYTTAALVRTFDLLAGNATIAGGNTDGLIPGTLVSGTGIPAGATVLNVINPTTFTLSANVLTGNTGIRSLTFTGVYEKEHPETKARMIRNQADTDNIFDNNDKLKLNYLPNAVFDSLYFSSNAGPSALNLRVQDALRDAITVNRSALGFYWVVSTAGNFTASSTAAFNTLYTRTFTRANLSLTLQTGDTTGLAVGMYISGSGVTPGTTIAAINSSTTLTMSATATDSGTSAMSFGYTLSTSITGGEEGQAATFPTTVTLEVGDWFVISKITGIGSAANPLVVTFAIINNVYETMTGATNSAAGAPGLVPAPAATQEGLYLRGDATWGTPAGTYAHPADGGSGFSVTAANGTVLSAVTVNTLGHVTSISSKTLAAADIPTLNQSTTGNAATATTLQTARTIGGVSFDGSANIDLPGVNAAGNQNTSGNAANVTGVVAIANGGTGQTTVALARNALGLGNTDGALPIANGGTGNVTAATALTALSGGSTAGSYLRGNGTVVALSTIQAADVPTLNQNTTGTAANVTGTVAIANGGTGATTKAAGFNALSPITTSGDIIYGDLAGANVRLAPGLTGQVLKLNTSFSTTKTGTTNSTTLITITNTSQLTVGQLVTGTGIPANSIITAISANVSITISNAATSSNSNITLTFTNVAPIWAADNNDTYSVTALGGLSVTSNNFRMNHPLFIQTATPTTPLAGTVWFDIN